MVCIQKKDPVENSHAVSFFKPILMRFCKFNKIKINKIARGTLNLSYHHGTYASGDPHVDHGYNHKVFMLYLNNVEGDTLIYNKVNDKQKCVIPIEELKKPLKIIKRIKPEQGKAVCWNGNYFHAASFCPPGKIRVVLVFTFI
jgi:hypothetical protein